MSLEELVKAVNRMFGMAAVVSGSEIHLHTPTNIPVVVIPFRNHGTAEAPDYQPGGCGMLYPTDLLRDLLRLTEQSCPVR